MEFWGLEVLPGTTVKIDPGENKYLHLSQASLGEAKKDKGENVPIFVKVDGKKLVLGTLSSEKCAQIQYDLVFEKEFEISHGSKNTSISFLGYKTVAMEEGDDMVSDEFDSQSESDEEVPLAVNVNGKPDKDKPKPAAAKPNAVKAEASAKPKPKVEELKKDVKAKADDDAEDDDDDDDDDASFGEDESDDDEEIAEGEDDSDEEDSSDEDDEETPKKAEVGSKRSAGSASKTPVPEKKAKVVSPAGNQKTGGKKGSGHVATPHPAKQGKTPANADKSKQQQTPKSAGSVTCKSCSKTFNSDNALQSHTKAKHSADK